MNVLQVNKLYFPEIGGIERVVQNIAEGLPSRYRVRVLASRSRGRSKRDRHNGVNVRKAASLGMALSVPISPTFPFHLRAELNDADVIHHHLPNPLSTVSQLANGTTDQSIVVTYHSDIVRQVAALDVYRPVLHRFLNRVDRILVTSDRLLSQSEVLAHHTKKCTVVPLSIDVTTVDSEEYTKPEREVSRPVVLFVGRLTYYKGVTYLLKAMRRVDATLLVVGDGERRASLEAQVDGDDLGDHVKFLGHVSEAELAGLYRAADIFVLPSVEPSEAFGIVQLEAMARGVPVVNTRLPTGVPWVSVDGETGLTVPPKDETALAEAINTLIEDDERRRKYGQQARARVEEVFTQEQMLQTIQTVYDEVTA